MLYATHLHVLAREVLVLLKWYVVSDDVVLFALIDDDFLLKNPVIILILQVHNFGLVNISNLG